MAEVAELAFLAFFGFFGFFWLQGAKKTIIKDHNNDHQYKGLVCLIVSMNTLDPFLSNHFNNSNRSEEFNANQNLIHSDSTFNMSAPSEQENDSALDRLASTNLQINNYNNENTRYDVELGDDSNLNLNDENLLPQNTIKRKKNFSLKDIPHNEIDMFNAIKSDILMDCLL